MRSAVHTAVGPVAIGRHRGQREQKRDQEVDRDVADRDHGGVQAGGIGQGRDRQQHAVIQQQIAQHRQPERDDAVGQPRRADDCHDTDRQDQPRDDECRHVAQHLRRRVLTGRDGQAENEQQHLVLALLHDAAHDQGDVQDHEDTDQRNETDESRDAAQWHDRDRYQPRGDRTSHEPAHQKQVLRDQPPDQ